MNLRRLPFWVLSRAQHVARWGIHPDYSRCRWTRRRSSRRAASRTTGSRSITDDGRFPIDAGCAWSALPDDFLDVRVGVDGRARRSSERECCELPPVNAREYDHEHRDLVHARADRARCTSATPSGRASKSSSTEPVPSPSCARGAHWPVMKRKVLYVLHNHPSCARGRGGVRPRAVPGDAHARPRSSRCWWRAPARAATSPRRGTPARRSASSGDDPNQYFLYTETTVRLLLRDLPRQERSTRPTSPTSCAPTSPTSCTSSTRTSSATTSLTLARRMLPDVPIVYTLHEYLPICHRDGQMVRTGTRRCASRPRRGAATSAFPDWPPQDFFLRERFIKSHLAHVDMFLAPEPVPARALRRLGDPAREAARSRTTAGCRRRPFESPDREPAAQPARLLRADQPVQGRRGAAGGDAAPARARRPTCTCSCTARTSTCCRPDEHELLVERARAQRRRTSRSPGRTARRPAAPDGRDRLGGGALALVGELAARDPGGVHARAAGDLQRHRRDGREGRPTASTACTSAPATRRASPRRSGARSARRACGSSCATGIPPIYAMDEHVASLTRSTTS